MEQMLTEQMAASEGVTENLKATDMMSWVRKMNSIRSRDRDGGGNLRLGYYDRSHEDKSLPFFGGDDTIREILGTTPHLKASKDEIRAFFEATADENARISYIKRIFNNDYTEVILSDGRRVGSPARHRVSMIGA